ncbi:2-polyprenyl-3-methyl-5-hydroxy-6-metoxy-1,4-benzoquinol methylase [Cryobacterium sp. MP_M5]|uniref:class I SAM-dependent methyltransferase n=1 Tax=unclassified Cryobacterium TaxID=2649013 RepID=UPI0018C9146C|nr:MULTISPECIES: methyltransferase domain-containing protein [unclassified Cryobacterium]MBG6059993.1 2-polyprenyl-3-methyl-5-hydroxy-6-metoxy-1,4-benzoquinol methylase [Cryobacterium sp. MP_M3]MEC5178411.1 2-polyprenyl-3-methyl-5-hydroxy-6-metoxy-1,4-benzoquinol methylase [Cryobacterium sp. MP_M5]
MTVYTHGYHESVLRSHRWRTAENSAAYLLPKLRHEDTLLDVGAGAGTITADFAGLVTEVTATEIGTAELELARATAAGRGVTNIDFQVADVNALEFSDNTFDVTHAHQVLQHIADPIQALREMARVTKPGGIVAVRDSDYSGFCWWPLIPELEEWLDLYRTAARANGGELDAGRRLLSWAHAAGLTDVTATSSTWCFATPADRAYWGGMWADRILNSAIAHQLVDSGQATETDLKRISQAWNDWSADDDGWFSILHGEVICHIK